VPHSVCASTAYSFRDITTPPTSKPSPAMNPSAIRTSGEMRLLSNEYLTKKATARNAASPPIQARSLTPMNCSQLMAGTSLRAGSNAGCDTGSMAGKGGSGETVLAATGTGGGAGETVGSSGVIRGGAGCAGGAAGCRGTVSAGAGAAMPGISRATGVAVGARSVPSFSRRTSNSSERRRPLSSSRLWRAPIARTMSQMPATIGTAMRSGTRIM